MPTYSQIKFSMGSYHLYHASHSLRKGRGGVSPSTDFETMARMMLESYILPNKCQCYFSYIIYYLNELYRGISCTCANSGYQALFSPMTERLGMRLCHTKLLLLSHTHIICTPSLGTRLPTQMGRGSLVQLHTWQFAVRRNFGGMNQIG